MEEKLRKLIDPSNECCCDYHLMAKCKEWALKQGYDIYTKCDGKDVFVDLVVDGYSEHRVYGIYEQQAVFDACQWLLENEG